MFKTVYRKLTKDQKERGIIYSSSLCKDGEPESKNIHEVSKHDQNKYDIIDNLKDVRFFRSMADDFNWNVVNIVRQ